MPPFLRVNTATFPSNAGIILSLEDSVRAGDTSALPPLRALGKLQFRTYRYRCKRFRLGFITLKLFGSELRLIIVYAEIGEKHENGSSSGI